MADKEENDDDALFTVTRKEWKDVIRIAREDGLHIHKTYDAFMAEKNKPVEGEEGTENPDKDGNPPPKKPEENEPPKKKGLWWGDREDD